MAAVKGISINATTAAILSEQDWIFTFKIRNKNILLGGQHVFFFFVLLVLVSFILVLVLCFNFTSDWLWIEFHLTP